MPLNKNNTIGERQYGLTLIEMMIALVLGLFVTAVIITVFSTNVRSNVENMKMIRLNQELRGAMTFMTDELKRSGYSAFPVTATFMKDLNLSSSSTCARYSYDAGGVKGTQDSNEQFGIKLDGNVIKWSNGAGADVGTLGSPDCSNGTWTALTTTDISKITALKFDISGSVNTNNVTSLSALTASSGVSVYDVTITLTGTTKLPHTDDDPRRTVTETIRIRNEDPQD